MVSKGITHRHQLLVLMTVVWNVLQLLFFIQMVIMILYHVNQNGTHTTSIQLQLRVSQDLWYCHWEDLSFLGNINVPTLINYWYIKYIFRIDIASETTIAAGALWIHMACVFVRVCTIYTLYCHFLSLRNNN